MSRAWSRAASIRRRSHAGHHIDTTQKTLRGAWGAIILCRSDWQKAIDSAVFPGTQGGPLMHAIAAKAVCFGEALKPEFKVYAKQVVANAKAMADQLIKRGMRLVSGGTDNHMMLVDVFSKGLTGKVAEAALGKAGITVIKNALPLQRRVEVQRQRPGGAPLVTTRGMREGDGRDRRLHRGPGGTDRRSGDPRLGARALARAVPKIPDPLFL
jgi:glycine hydroxymethyltransferase